MSDARMTLVALAACAVVAASAPAQARWSATELQRQQDSVQAQARALRASADSAARDEGRRGGRLDVPGLPIRVGFNYASVTAADTARIAEGIRDAVAAARRRFGDQLPGLVDTATWELYGQPRTGAWALVRGAMPLVLYAGNVRVVLTRPVDPAEVSRFTQERLGEAIATRMPELRAYHGAGFVAGLTDEQWFVASRDLSVSWAAVGRRCAAGNLPACEVVVSPFRKEGALERYFDRTDYPFLAASGSLPSTADSTAFASRQRCREGADTACARIVDLVDINDPISAPLRGTLAMHAFELAGEQAAERLRTAPRGAPLPFLAHVAGVSPEDLVRSWRARIGDALSRGRTGTSALLVSTAAWVALLLLVVGRRRPA